MGDGRYFPNRFNAWTLCDMKYQLCGLRENFVDVLSMNKSSK